MPSEISATGPAPAFITKNNNVPYDVTTLLFLAVSGIIFKLFFSAAPSKLGEIGPASSVIWGYGLTAASLSGLLIVLYAISTRRVINMGLLANLKLILKNSFPIVATLIVLAWIIVLFVTYSRTINQGVSAPQFNQFSLFSTILLCIQMAIVIKYILDKIGIKVGPSNISNPIFNKMHDIISGEMSNLITIITLLNLIMVGMMQVVLQFFTTDG